MHSTVMYLAIGSLFTGFTLPAVAQELPQPILMATLRHLAENDSSRGRFSSLLVTRSFPDKVAAAAAGRALGMEIYATRSEVIACSNARPPTCDVADGAHVIDLQRFEVGGDTAVIRVVISTHVRHKDGGARLFPVLREITLNQVRGVWRVVGDAVLMRA